jgi:hypothetical protein
VTDEELLGETLLRMALDDGERVGLDEVLERFELTRADLRAGEHEDL